MSTGALTADIRKLFKTEVPIIAGARHGWAGRRA
jgi:hypothetical protein